MQGKVSTLLLGSIAGASMILTMPTCKDAGKKPESRPNVIIVLTDDQGYGDLSAHGHPILKTPILDKLHGQSIRFTDFHVAPMCTPTRSQLLTGRDAMANGATSVCMGRSMMREELPTMADIFKASGYQTALFGKWHLGDSYPHRPQDRGFQEVVNHGAWGIGAIADHWGNTYWNDTYWHNGKPEKYEGYCTDVWFDLTCDYIRSQDKDDPPFFIYLATNCPHMPHLCDDKYSDPYLEQGVNKRLAKFYGQIANIDENMGHLMDVLDETGQSGNTILIFMTDNGTATQRGSEIFNAGMRGHKTEPYEGGHRVPMFVRWPDGNLGDPRDIDILAQVQDVLPTLNEWCALEQPGNALFDGSSLVPAIEGNPEVLEERILVVEYENPYRPSENRAVMWKKWRLVKDKELYDLVTDPGQTNDVAEKHPDVAHMLLNHYQKWRKKIIPYYEKERYIHLGTENQNPLMLYSSDWQGSYADNVRDLIAGDRIGYWVVNIVTPGNYEFSLSRWHPDSAIPLEGSMKDYLGRDSGKLPMAYARLRLGEYDQTVAVSEGQTKVIFRVHLPLGINKVETWFLDKEKKPLCSAYYTNTELIK